MKHLVLALTIALAPAAAFAADDPVPRIIVGGNGSVRTPPDRVAIGFGLHGEGTTSDEAVSALVAKGKAVEAGIAALAGADPARATQMSVNEVRGSACNRNGYPPTPRLSTGDCAIIGYTADQQLELRTANVKEAGTLVGLIGRLGGTNPRIDRFFLADEAAARARALAAALAEAKAQAEAIAAGTHVSLGHILSVSNGGYAQPFADEVVVSGSHVPAPPPPPPPPPPPVGVSLKPQSIETQAHVQVVFAIGS